MKNQKPKEIKEVDEENSAHDNFSMIFPQESFVDLFEDESPRINLEMEMVEQVDSNEEINQDVQPPTRVIESRSILPYNFTEEQCLEIENLKSQIRPVPTTKFRIHNPHLKEGMLPFKIPSDLMTFYTCKEKKIAGIIFGFILEAIEPQFDNFTFIVPSKQLVPFMRPFLPNETEKWLNITLRVFKQALMIHLCSRNFVILKTNSFPCYVMFRGKASREADTKTIDKAHIINDGEPNCEFHREMLKYGVMLRAQALLAELGFIEVGK